jgi:hypothetical protein
MEIFERAKDILYKVATFNIAGNHSLGGVSASLLAFPLIMLGRVAYRFSIDLFYNSLIISTLLFLIMLQFVLESLPIDRRNDIVINRVPGILLGYYYIPLHIKFILFTIIIFHALRTVLPKFILTNWKIDLEATPGLLGTVSLDIITGITTNICMHFLRLILG